MEKNEARRELGSVAFAALLVGGALTAFAYRVPLGSNAAEREIENRRRVFSIQWGTAFAEGDDRMPPADYDLENHERVVAADGALRCGCGGLHAPGDHGEPDRRYAVEGPGDNPDPHLARLRDEQRLPPVVFSLPLRVVTVADPDAPIRPWGRESSSGMDHMSAHGEIWGDEMGAAEGLAEEHQRSSHGGATKFFDPELAEAGEPRVLHTGLTVEGPLRASEVLKSMLRTLAEAEKCYRGALEKEPHLSANLTLAFDVLPEGEISEVVVFSSVEGSSQPASPTVSQLKICLGEGVSSTRFPLRSGSSRIKYPLLLRPGAQLLASDD